jgi:uncharacterized membrane protein YcfT
VTAEPRVDWIDYAKGICIVAVVSMYTTYFANDTYSAIYNRQSISWMNYWVEFARPFRMPDFFLLSGLFLGRVVDRPWREYFDKRVLHYLYFFLLWTLIFFFVRNITPGTDLLGRVRILILMLVKPFHMLWFIQMLSVYCLTVRWTRHLPPALVFATVVGLESLHLDGQKVYIPILLFCQYLVYFYAGFRLSDWVFRLTRWAQEHPLGAVLGLLAWGLANGYLVYLDWAELRGVSVVLGFAGALAIAVGGALLSRYAWMSWLRYLGEHSIVVYLAFFLPLMFLTLAWSHFRITWDQGWSTVLMTVASIVTSLTLYWWTKDTTLDFLFNRPTWARLRPTSTPNRSRRSPRPTLFRSLSH